MPHLANHLDRLVAGDLDALEAESLRLRREHPLVGDSSVDVVVSNCVLNLVSESGKSDLIREIFRVLRVGGRIAISDIVSDEPIPQELKDDPELWSGCISGAFHELDLLREFEAAGFHGIQLEKWEHDPFAIVGGIEFRSITVTAYKGKQGPCLERNQAVIYRGPFKKVEDDDDHVYYRGERMAVCDKTFRLLQKQPYAGRFEMVEPLDPVALEEAERFDCSRPKHRHPRETKGQEYDATTEAGGMCIDGGNCC